MASEEPIYKMVEFDPASLTIEDIAFITLCRCLSFGTISDISIHDGRPTVVKVIQQRLDLTVTKEGLPVATGAISLVTGNPRDLLVNIKKMGQTRPIIAKSRKP